MPKTKKTETKPGLVKMKSIAKAPQNVPGVGEVPVDGTFKVPLEQAKILEKGLFKRVKGGE